VLIAFFEVFSNKCEFISAIQYLQLFDNTVTRRIQVDVLSHQKSDRKMCERFSLQFDESTAIGGQHSWNLL
jgi:hypothetical protein